MTIYAKHVTAPTQAEKAHKAQKKNNAGGYTFAVDRWKQLDRFLVLGAEGGTYYVTERALARENAGVVEACLNEDALRAVARIAEVSKSGRAPKNDAAIFALAMAMTGSPEARAAARGALPVVCRTGTHLFTFAANVDAMRGWGRGLRRAVASWYTSKEPAELAYQVLKYQQRNGWSHRDLLRLSHARSPKQNAVLRWASSHDLADREVGMGAARRKYGAVAPEELPPILAAYDALRGNEKASETEWCAAIAEHGLTHEMVPSELKNSPAIWSALLDRMPIGAMIRNLGKMSAVGVLNQGSDGAGVALRALADAEKVRRGRVHPIAVLSAARVYAQGHGEKGSLSWTPNPRIIDALNDAFYTAFEGIQPTGKRILLALDVSGSMTSSPGGPAGLSARDVSSAMAMATARTEQEWSVMAFSHGFVPINISPKQRLDDIVSATQRLPFDRTDCAMPMVWAGAHKASFDAFVVYTDNETWSGVIHPHLALQRYRQQTGINAKLVVCATAATPFTIANPEDPGMLDVVGFSSDAPAVLADFIREE